MRVFLTGGTGFIGQPLARALVARDWQVTALVRRPQSAQAQALAELGLELVSGDVTERESMRAAMAGSDIVVHNAAWYELGIRRGSRMRMRATNVEGTQNTLGLAVELGVPKIVYTSSVVTYGTTGGRMVDERFERQSAPQSCYEETKTEAHALATALQRDGAPIVIACPGGVIGPGDPSGVGYLLRMYVRGLLPPVLWAAEGRRAHVYVDDAAEGIARCAERGRVGESYILSNGVMRHRDMFALWQQTPGGSKRTLFWLPKPLAMLVNAVAEPFERLLRLPLVFSREFGRAAFASWSFSAAKAERELGMEFRPLEQAWHETLAEERRRAGR